MGRYVRLESQCIRTDRRNFSDGITISVPGLESATPLKVDFDYVLAGSCGATEGFSCVADFQIQVLSTTIQRVLVSQSGATAPTSGMTGQGSIFDGFEFSLGVSLNVTARGSAASPPGGGSAQGNFSHGEITRMYVYDEGGAEIDPSFYSVDFVSGAVLPVPEPGAALQGIA